MSYPNTFFRPDQIEKLRCRVARELSEKRMAHVLAVEDMAFRIGLLFYWNDIETMNLLRAAALLHDVVKELTDEEQLAILADHSVTPLPEDLASMPTIHALTGALIIPDKFPELADERLINAVRYHTTGKADMTIYEKIIYLADYIDMSRKFEDCVKLRDYFFDFDFEKSTKEEAISHLNDTLIMSYNLTIRGLLEDDKHIDTTTFEARNYLVLNK